jgi:hypothetical protein
VAYYVALPFVANDDGICGWRGDRMPQSRGRHDAREALSRKEGHIGTVAFSRNGDPATGDFRDAKVNRKSGNVPDDLSAL